MNWINKSVFDIQEKSTKKLKMTFIAEHFHLSSSSQRYISNWTQKTFNWNETAYCHCQWVPSYIQAVKFTVWTQMLLSLHPYRCVRVCLYLLFSSLIFLFTFYRISMRSAGLPHKMMFFPEFRCCMRMCVRHKA